MKLLMLALLWVPVQDRERDVERKKEGEKQERERDVERKREGGKQERERDVKREGKERDRKRDAQKRERESRAMRMKSKKMREAERARALTAARKKLESQIVAFGDSIRAGEDEAVQFFKTALSTSAGKVVMRDRAHEASDKLRQAAERALVGKHLKGGEYALKEGIRLKVDFFRAYEKQIGPIRTMIREIADKIPNERGRNGTMRAALLQDSAAHVLYTSMFRRWYRNMIKSGRGGITDAELIEMASERPAEVLKTYLVNNLLQKVGETYTVNTGELYYYSNRSIAEYARKKVFHADINRAAATLGDPTLKAFYSSYLGKDHIEDAHKLELQAIRDKVYDGLGDWVDRHFRATEGGRVLKEGSREELQKAVAQIRKVQEGLKNDDF